MSLTQRVAALGARDLCQMAATITDLERRAAGSSDDGRRRRTTSASKRL